MLRLLETSRAIFTATQVRWKTHLGLAGSPPTKLSLDSSTATRAARAESGVLKKLPLCMNALSLSGSHTHGWLSRAQNEHIGISPEQRVFFLRQF